MATITSTSFVNYIGTTSGASSIVGYESESNRVARFQFTSPAEGASEVSVSIKLSYQGGDYSPDLRFYITTSPTSHIDANAEAAYHGSLSTSGGVNIYTATATASTILLPNTTYYLWIFPGNTTYSWWAHYGEVTITTSGDAGLIYIGNGSGYDAYQIYVGNGSGYDLYIPYIGNGTDWDLYS